MGTQHFCSKTKIYNAPDGGVLRRIRRRDGISFTANLLQEGGSDKIPASIAVELQLTSQHGDVLIIMRRTTRRLDSWYCNTSSIRLPPAAATDLANSLTSFTKGLKP